MVTIQAPPPEAVRKFVDELATKGIKYVRFELPDLHGMSRAKLAPLGAVAGYAQRGLNMYGGTVALDTASHIIAGTGYHEEVRYADQLLFPDLESVRVLTWLPHTAKVICDTAWESGEPLRAAPRYVLQKVLAEAAQMGFDVLMAHEYEFYVLDEHRQPLFDGVHVFHSVRNQWHPALDDLLERLLDLGIELITHNCEYAPSQFEINYRAALNLRAADNAFTIRNAIKELMHRAGLHATFMTKPWPDRAGSGCHFHISLVDRERRCNAFVDTSRPLRVSKVAQHFVAGQLAHAPAILALAAPTPNCYHRLKPHTFAPSNVGWGIEDRSAMVRVKATGDERTHVENRAPSSLANPYLSAAATLAAGLLGIKHDYSLPPPLEQPAEEDQSLAKLPSNLTQSLSALDEDQPFREMLGEEFCRVYTTVKRAELTRFQNHITDWERSEYLEVY